MSQRSVAIGVVLVILFGIVGFGIIGGRRQMPATVVHEATLGPVNGIESDNAHLVSLGQRIYFANCTSCHGAKLQGQPNWQTIPPGGPAPAPPLDASGRAWQRSDEALFAITKFGGQASALPDYRSAIPGYQQVLGDSELWAVLSYVKSTWPAETRAAQERANQVCYPFMRRRTFPLRSDNSYLHPKRGTR